jgi:FkbM family methyltransferase
MVVPIIQGPLRGKRWVVGSSNHGCWLGSYEFQKQQIFIKTVSPGCVVYDIGAHVGFYTLLSSVLVGSQGKVLAFEPVPRNLQYLRRHVQMNCCPNVSVFPYAVSDMSGKESFDPSINSSMGYFSKKGGMEVTTITLDELIKFTNIPLPDVAKIDVEGAEFRVLMGGRQTIEKKKPILFLALHSPENLKSCSELLQRVGYRCEALNGTSTDDCDEFLAIPR